MKPKDNRPLIPQGRRGKARKARSVRWRPKASGNTTKPHSRTLWKRLRRIGRSNNLD